MQPFVVQERPGKRKRRWIAASGRSLDLGAAGISQAQQAGHLVERFARRVVGRAAQKLVLERAVAQIQAGVPARNDQSDARIDLAVGIGELAGVKMAFEVVDGDQAGCRVPAPGPWPRSVPRPGHRPAPAGSRPRRRPGRRARRRPGAGLRRSSARPGGHARATRSRAPRRR